MIVWAMRTRPATSIVSANDGYFDKYESDSSSMIYGATGKWTVKTKYLM